jgi:hypothetical protein
MDADGVTELSSFSSSSSKTGSFGDEDEDEEEKVCASWENFER